MSWRRLKKHVLEAVEMIKEMSQIEMGKDYLQMIKDGVIKANTYSWKKHATLSKLALSTAHRYSEMLQAFLEGRKRFSNRQCAAKYGKGFRVSTCLKYGDDFDDLLDAFNDFCRSQGWRNHIASKDIPF